MKFVRFSCITTKQALTKEPRIVATASTPCSISTNLFANLHISDASITLIAHNNLLESSIL